MVSSVTPFSDMAPSPRVDVLIDDADLDGSTVEVTLWQLSSAGEFEVRSAVRRSSVGGFFITDYEPPLGVPVTYRVQEFDEGGAEVAFTLTMDTEVAATRGMVVIQDPLVPERAALVGAEIGFAGRLRHSRSARIYKAGDQTIALLGQRGLLEELSLQCWTEDPATRDALDLVLSESQFLVRSGPEFPIPRIVHVVVPEPVRLPFDYQNGGTTDRWELSGSQVSRTELDIIVPVVSYSRFNAAFATYAEFNAAYSTYLSAISNPPPAA